jgi:hypothetical protein
MTEMAGLRCPCWICPAPGPCLDGTSRRHLIRSRYYKNVTDADGNHVSAGEDREVPWVAIAPVVRAIRVLERIVPDGELLLSATHHNLAFGRRRGRRPPHGPDQTPRRPQERLLPARPHPDTAGHRRGKQLRQNIATLRQTIAGQREEIRDLRHQVTQLTLAAAVLTQARAEIQAAPVGSDNVVPPRPDNADVLPQ